MRNRQLYLMSVIALLMSLPCGASGQSPFRLEATREALLFGSGAMCSATGAVLGLYVDPPSAEDIAALDRADLPPFDRPATYAYSADAEAASDILVALLIASPAAVLADERMAEDAPTIGGMYVETMLFSYGLSSITKNILLRTRPYAYNEDVPLADKQTADTRRSFPSGHSTFAFASVVFLNVVYGAYHPASELRPWFWGGGMLAAGTVAALRVGAGKHFLSDVLAGAVLGSAIGWSIPLLHRPGAAGWSLRVAPSPGGAAVAISRRL